MLGAIDEAMQDPAWERANPAERRILLARAICAAFDGEHHKTPARAALDAAIARADRDPRIRALHREGLAIHILARRFGLSARQIRRICGH